MLEEHKNEERLFDFSLQLLGRRKHTSFELSNKLKRKSFSSEKNIKKIIERLEKLNLINDLDFAQDWISYRSNRSPRGRILLSFEMMKKGIDRGDIDQAFLDSDYQEIDCAEVALDKKFSKKEDSIKFKNKLFLFLKNRGFNAGVIQKTVAEFLAN